MMMKEERSKEETAHRPSHQSPSEHIPSRKGWPSAKEITEFYRKTRKPHDEYTAIVIRAIFVKPASYLIAKYTNITPTQITVFNIIPGILSLFFLYLGGKNTLIGALLAFVFALLDGMDGIIARAKGLHSKFGQWLDGVTGYVLYPLMMLSAAIGLHDYWSLVIGCIASLCFPLQFCLVHYYKSEIKESNERIEISSSGRFEFIKYIYGSATFFPLLLLAALFGKVIYVLLFFAIFGNLFWMIVILMQFRDLRRTAG